MYDHKKETKQKENEMEIKEMIFKYQNVPCKQFTFYA